MLRILHFSDIHLRAPYSALPISDMGPKRVLGAANLVLRRESHFRAAQQKVAALVPLAEDCNVDLVICTGDYTALGTHAELEIARAAIEPLTRRRLGFVTVPGNHDVYVDSAVSEKRFETHFGEFLKTDMPEYVVDGEWPLVRLYDDDVAVVAINGARPNPQLWRSSGHVPKLQLDSLARILRDTRIAPRRVLLLSHYAMQRENGKPDHPWHGLSNVDELFQVLATHPRVSVLHGHIHHRYSHPLGASSGRVFGAGSATYKNREGLWVYELDAGHGLAIPGRWSVDRFVLDRAESVSIFGP